ncbi:acyl-CoA synthetase (AMP-forming)/AMP-acid ligase II [Streptomyces sp. BK208]|uniref:AMP-binding protein n=1 Tax=Streptomyces sp. BK208 TaxID=2512150 RepID=UPI0010E6B93B|nr:AMP-binding protein [Streptomyces sp. BK208]TDT42698.1 acyl-CoA synthetase (AMP-forming)/AMP-acid ligase II [Streptomyces sp. BK208]
MITDRTVADRTSDVTVRPRPATLPPRTALTLDGVFATAALRRPGAIAVQDDQGPLTYARAEAQSARLGSLLVRGGVQLGDPVIVHCDDHRRSLVAQLAVLKAGGVCVPVPPGAPEGRLTAVAALTGARVVLCGVSTGDRWPRRRVLVLDDPLTLRLSAAHHREHTLPRSAPHEAAHLLASGAGGPLTGQLADHAAWRLALTGATRAAGLPVRHVVVCGPPGTPHALAALWWAVSFAGTLHCLPRPGAPAPAAARAAVVVSSPEEYAERLPELRTRPRLVRLLGGPVPPELAARHFAALPTTPLRAEFAPGGGAFPWAVRDLTAEDGTLDERVIGLPAPGVRVRVLDRDQRAVPVWCTGELCAEGPALPFDTIHGPGRTAPPAAHPALLRSAVAARRRADGLLELAGPVAGSPPGRHRRPPAP